MKILLCLLTLLSCGAVLHGMMTKKDSHTFVTSCRGDLYCITSALRSSTPESSDSDNKLIASINSSLRGWRARVNEIIPKSFADFCTANRAIIHLIGEPNFLLYFMIISIEEDKSELLRYILLYAGLESPGKFLCPKMRQYAMRRCFELVGRLQRDVCLAKLIGLLGRDERLPGSHYALRTWCTENKESASLQPFIYQLLQAYEQLEDLFPSLKKFVHDYIKYAYRADHNAVLDILQYLEHKKFVYTVKHNLHNILAEISEGVRAPYDAIKKDFKEAYVGAGKDPGDIDRCVLRTELDEDAIIRSARTGDSFVDELEADSPARRLRFSSRLPGASFSVTHVGQTDVNAESKVAVGSGVTGVIARVAAKTGEPDDGEWEELDRGAGTAETYTAKPVTTAKSVFAGLGSALSSLGLF